MPQTRFVTRKALELGLQPVVVVNKGGPVGRRSEGVHDEVLELFMELDAADHQLDAPFLYASGRAGWAARSLEDPREDLSALSRHHRRAGAAPQGWTGRGPSRCWCPPWTTPPTWRIATAGCERGKVRVGGSRWPSSPSVSRGCWAPPRGPRPGVTKLFGFEGLQRVDIEEAQAGDTRGAGRGSSRWTIGQTLTDPTHRERMKGIAVEEPTLSVDISVNKLPLRRAGGEVHHHPAGEGSPLQGAGAECGPPGGGDRAAGTRCRSPVGGSCTSPS